MPEDILTLVRQTSMGEGFHKPFGKHKEYQGPCPLCGGHGKSGKDRSDRFRVYPKQDPKGEIAREHNLKGGYACRKCGVAGDYISYLIDVEKRSWSSVLSYIGAEPAQGRRQGNLQAANVTPTKHRVQSIRPLSDLDPIELPKPLWRDHAKKFFEGCECALTENPQAMEYLRGRGVVDAVAKKFHFGWHQGRPQRYGNMPCSYKQREAWGLPPKQRAGKEPSKLLWLPQGIVIPKLRGSEVVALRIRKRPTPAKGPSYHMVEGGKGGCWIYPAREKAYVIVESELDGATILSAGVPNVGVCCIGSLSCYPDARAAAELSGALCLLNALDFEPGSADKTGAERVFSWWKKTFPRTKRAPVPVGKDPGELFQKMGHEGIRAWIESVLPPAVKMQDYVPQPVVGSPLLTQKIPSAIKHLYDLQLSSGLLIRVADPKDKMGFGLEHVAGFAYDRDDPQQKEVYKLLLTRDVKQWIYNKFGDATVSPGELLELEW